METSNVLNRPKLENQNTQYVNKTRRKLAYISVNVFWHMLLAYSAHAFLFLEKRIFRCSWPNVLAIKMQWPAVAHRFSSFDVSAENVTDSTFISLSITPWLPVDLQMAHYLSRIVDLFFKKSFKQICLAVKFLSNTWSCSYWVRDCRYVGLRSLIRYTWFKVIPLKLFYYQTFFETWPG